jgi:hypothetical protein
MSNRYSTNQFYNFTKYETVGYGPNVRDVDDNPGFIWPKPAVRNAANGTNVAVSRGYMRMLSQAYGDGADLAKRRFHFQFNPDVLVRQVEARNDVQLWMNQDPAQFVNPIPGQANFAFDFILNREAEVASRSYRAGYDGDVRAVTDNTVLPGDTLGQTVKYPPGQTPTIDSGGGYVEMGNYSKQSVVDIGVLADLFVFDQIIGQGMNQDILKKYYGKVESLASAYNAGVTSRNEENSTSDEEDKPPKEQEIVLDDVQKFISGNIGNSAFLVSQPVRIVFSSLFMVEGFISSTTVTFNKFNSNMVPTQCTVNVQMQAMYIGFATKNTFLTRNLELQLTDEQLADQRDSEAKRERQALVGVADNVFEDIKKGGGGNDEILAVKDLLQGGDPLTKLSAIFMGTSDLANNLNEGYVTEVVGSLEVKVTYKGLDGVMGPNSNIPVGTLVHSVTSDSVSIASKDSLPPTRLTKQKIFKIPKKTAVANEDWDKDENAKWEVELKMTFHLKTSGDASEIRCSQFAAFKKTVTTEEWITAEDFTLHGIKPRIPGNPYGT